MWKLPGPCSDLDLRVCVHGLGAVRTVMRERVRDERERVHGKRERVRARRERVLPPRTNGCPGCGGYVLEYLAAVP